ncbi:LamG domain-containing protein, partial [Candidatus Pacearchaeota archaeon]|nr:LamG domain-containing protein [Candidatus Pacearchaeota archaeon]
MINLSENESKYIFDLKIASSSSDENSTFAGVEFDYIVDPSAIINISFVSPTPDNGSSISGIAVPINVSISADNISEVKYNWNGTNYSAIYNDSLILMLNFDNLASLGESENVNVVDGSKYGNNGTISPGVVFNSTGKYGGAYTFTNKTTYINISNPGGSLNISGNTITIAAWVNWDGVWTHGWIVSKMGPSAGSYGMYLDSNRVLFGLNTGSGWGDTACTNIYASANIWHHVAVIYNGSAVVCYVDGVASAPVARTGNLVPVTGKATIGWESGWDTQSFNGSIDEVLIFNRTLSSSEILGLYSFNLQKYNSTQWYLRVNQSVTEPFG